MPITTISTLVLAIFFLVWLVDVGKHVLHLVFSDVLQNVSPDVFFVHKYFPYRELYMIIFMAFLLLWDWLFIVVVWFLSFTTNIYKSLCSCFRVTELKRYCVALSVCERRTLCQFERLCTKGLFNLKLLLLTIIKYRLIREKKFSYLGEPKFHK